MAAAAPCACHLFRRDTAFHIHKRTDTKEKMSVVTYGEEAH